MTELPTPPVPDLARIAGATVDEVVSWLLVYYDTTPIPWSYRSGTRCIKSAYRGLHSLPQLLAGCDSEKIAQSKVSNREIVQLAAPIAFGRSTQVFDLPRRQFAFGRDRHAAYRIPFFFVEDGVVKLYYLQPRKGASPTYEQLCMVATIHKRFLLDTEFFGQKAEVEYVDLSADPETNDRRVSQYSLKTLELWSESRLQDRLTLISEALDRVSRDGLVTPRRHHIHRPEADMPLFD